MGSHGSEARLPIPEKYLKGLDPTWEKIWNEHGTSTVRADELAIEAYRANPEKYSFTYPTWKGPEVFHVEDRRIPVHNPDGEIDIRIYTPEGPGPFPVHVNFHGGGWCLGGLQTDAAWCRVVCNTLSIKVIDVAYRLAPEFQFPVNIYDCWQSVKWIIQNSESLNIIPTSISIGGISAGAQMSAVLAHWARDEGIPLKLQILTGAGTDLRYVPVSGPLDASTCPYESAIFYADMPWGAMSRLSWFVNYWIGTDPVKRKEILNDYRCNPALAKNFSNLCPAFVATAEFDQVRDEGEHYADLLRKGGNLVTCKRYLGVPHAFGIYNHPERGLEQGRQYIRDCCAELKKAHDL